MHHIPVCQLGAREFACGPGSCLRTVRASGKRPVRANQYDRLRHADLPPECPHLLRIYRPSVDRAGNINRTEEAWRPSPESGARFQCRRRRCSRGNRNRFPKSVPVSLRSSRRTSAAGVRPSASTSRRGDVVICGHGPDGIRLAEQSLADPAVPAMRDAIRCCQSNQSSDKSRVLRQNPLAPAKLGP